MTHVSPILAAMPWTDRQGRLSVLRLIVFLILLAPAADLLFFLFFGPVFPEPYELSLHESGDWAVRFLVLSLAVTPARRIFSWNKLIGVRRMIGVSVLFYVLLHLLLYTASEHWNLAKVISEIALRFYLTIGFVALLGLSALGVTSFDRMIRKMGRRWNQLHMLVYPIAVLALWHYFLQSKSDVTSAVLLAGLFALLMIYRLVVRLQCPLANPGVLAGCAAGGAAATAGIEYAWYALATGIPAKLVFLANFNVEYEFRPAVWVGIVGLCVAAVRVLQMLLPMIRGRLKAA
ncbi:sulfite oxidase heme-binding subunit YedZ [Roseibium litorale]|uniref:Protein-methionine-sulfoxide reductase heme-binding subunit MsrQ n=1 Tax=Roseibium litorale TaxID=2803841 RepID=A0ABR9CTG2_9HYPH|nr:ferric reductase-like transmembrane domain-containing protein [Roseibium litorale]MBD8894140.1 ferric reductase-like transmembrane domain-containing protein [Roseibium litorale]